MTGLWLRAFTLTLLVELAVATPLLGPASVTKRLSAVALANLLSHPLAWFVLPSTGLSGIALLVLIEAWAIASELALYRLVFPSSSWLRLAGLSAVANGASLAAGALVRATVGGV